MFAEDNLWGVANDRETKGAVDIRLYAAARPWMLEGKAAVDCMLHRALAEKVLVAGGLMLC